LELPESDHKVDVGRLSQKKNPLFKPKKAPQMAGLQRS